MAPNKRASHSAAFKLKVIKYAEDHNNSAAGREYQVNEKLVRDWIKKKDIIEKMPKKKCAMRGLKCKWPALENTLKLWVEDLRRKGLIVTRNAIRLKAKDIANEQNIAIFTATRSWCSRFMKRNNLVLRNKTKIAQKLPADLEEKITKFHSFIIRKRQINNYGLTHIGNMDETPVWFDMPTSKTVNTKGEKTVLIKTTGHEKSRFTVVLACMADGTKLKPLIIFKRKTMPKDKFPGGVVVHAHAKGWMDEAGTKLWVSKVWDKRPGRQKSLLVWDSFSAHLVNPVKDQLHEDSNTDIAVIPGGLTSIYQYIVFK